MKLGPNERTAMAERLLAPAQVPSADSIENLPPYLDSFLAHLRLLIGVPFHNLVPDARLLPTESIRFFYLDRSWTDRLVDGALAVGQVGTRERAHVRAHGGALQQSLDDSETLVRDLQRKRIDDYAATKSDPERERREADVLTGFLLRSSLVSGWPHLEVRAFRSGTQLETARLERLSPGVLIALFGGVPDRVELEEPHHGVQFGIDPEPGGYKIFIRKANGEQVKQGNVPQRQDVPLRAGGLNVVHTTELRRRLQAQRVKFPSAIEQTGSAAFGISVLNPPFQQPFAGAGGTEAGPGDFGGRVLDVQLSKALRAFVKGGTR